MDDGLQRRFQAGELIFAEGDLGDCAYLIEVGRVLIFLAQENQEVSLRVLGEGEVLGEMSLIDSSPRSASCRALSDCKLILVTKEQLVDRVQEADPIIRLLMQVLLERLRSQNDLLRGKVSAPLQLVGLDPFAVHKKEALLRIGLEHRISEALIADEFLPYYQPIYDLTTGLIVGCEALMRWISKDNGLVSPAVFMDVMEDSSLILIAGKMMIEKSLNDLIQISAAFPDVPDFFVSINVSGRQFTHIHFIEELEAIRKSVNLPAARIKLELTERIMTEGTKALNTLKECRNLGYQLAIDDFGTGFSSLQYLAQMPLTDLKIDRSFVSKMLSDSKAMSIIQSLIFLAYRLGLHLIAEGVETAEELACLKSLNIDMAQGFLLSRPVPLAALLSLGTSHKEFMKKSA